MEETFAHTPAKNTDVWDTLENHLIEVSLLAKEFCKPFGAEKEGELLGLLHDIGKSTSLFQQYLKDAHSAAINNTEPPAKGSADHKRVGALAVQYIPEIPKDMRRILGHIILGHHGGLKDDIIVSEEIQKPEILELYKNNKETIDQWISFVRSKMDLSQIKSLDEHKSMDLYIRMLFSALVNADWSHTEKHLSSWKADLREDIECTKITSELLEKITGNQKTLITKADKNPTKVNTLRKEIYQICMKSADIDNNFFVLQVPTGGGKTRSGMSFALKHAIKTGKKRIIVVLPFTSIIDQNAEEYISIFGRDAVLEHHSGVDAYERFGVDTYDDVVKYQISCETWNKPIIITTNVQLLESLFSNRPSQCIKNHNIMNSIILFDEVQSLPTKYINPIMNKLKELMSHYGVTVIFSTATQPPLHHHNRIIKGIGREPIQILPNYKKYFEMLQRVKYVFVRDSTIQDTSRRIGQNKQHLCIVNTKRNAVDLFNELKKELNRNEYTELDRKNCYYLSTLLYPQHRKQIIGEIKEKLKNQEPCRVVSTQLVEAGVDIDFPTGTRDIAGIDSIIQAAGRVNREGLLEEGILYISDMSAWAGRVPNVMGDYCRGQWIARNMINNNVDLNDPDIFSVYFNQLWGNTNLDADQIQNSESDDNLRFETVDTNFRVIVGGAPVVVVTLESSEILDKIVAENVVTKQNWRKLQQYTITHHIKDLATMMSKNPELTQLSVGGILTWNGNYDPKMGVVFKK